jgi:ABC-type protease/lipase transport system fused ATPase/permease subunit
LREYQTAWFDLRASHRFHIAPFDLRLGVRKLSQAIASYRKLSQAIASYRKLSQAIASNRKQSQAIASYRKLSQATASYRKLSHLCRKQKSPQWILRLNTDINQI